MSGGWSLFVMALVGMSLIGCVWLLWSTGRELPGAPPADQTTHVWDEDLTEYNKPLPRWWIILFYLTIVFSVGYLVWYPGAGRLAGLAGWTSTLEHDADRRADEARLAKTFEPYAGQAIEVLAKDPRALALGRSVFDNNCAACHGSAAQGAVGYPNLTDTIWHWGGSPDQVTQTVLAGRQAAMPAWAAPITAMAGPSGIQDVTSYVLSLSHTPGVDAASAAKGKTVFAALCAACHGPTGTGNALVGAPDLTDAYWLYGGSRDAIADTIAAGRNGRMPAHAPLLGETRARLAAAYVWALSQP